MTKYAKEWLKKKYKPECVQPFGIRTGKLPVSNSRLLFKWDFK